MHVAPEKPFFGIFCRHRPRRGLSPADPRAPAPTVGLPFLPRARRSVAALCFTVGARPPERQREMPEDEDSQAPALADETAWLDSDAAWLAMIPHWRPPPTVASAPQVAEETR